MPPEPDERLSLEAERPEGARSRARAGLLAGWVGIISSLLLFGLKTGLGLAAGSVSVVADSVNLLSHLANSVTLTVSASLLRRPATAEKPFGRGRLEHVTPLVMSVILFSSGLKIALEAGRQLLEPHTLAYWTGLPWVLGATIIIKGALGRFVCSLGRQVNSRAIMASAAHHRIEAALTVAVIAGLVASQHLGRPEIDGCVGLLAAAWILYLGFDHGREAITPLLGQPPSAELIERIRRTARSVAGVEDVHEIIVHDYGTMYIISLHVEVPARLGPEEMHEAAERCEARLRQAFGGEVVAHTDPLLEPSPEVRAIEERFRELLRGFPEITDYHDFRVVAHSAHEVIVVADLDTAASVPGSQFASLAARLEEALGQALPNLAYASFYVTPRFAY